MPTPPASSTPPLTTLLEGLGVKFLSLVCAAYEDVVYLTGRGSDWKGQVGRNGPCRTGTLAQVAGWLESQTTKGPNGGA